MPPQSSEPEIFLVERPDGFFYGPDGRRRLADGTLVEGDYPGKSPYISFAIINENLILRRNETGLN